MLIEVHIIQNHAPSNLNRDDSGSPKSAIFGGYRRARISSQCLKRCYRTSKTFRDEVSEDIGMHTCSMPDEVIRRVLKRNVQLTEKEQSDLKKKLAELAKSKKKSDSSKSSNNTEENNQTANETSAKTNELKTAQSIFWRQGELEILVEEICKWANSGKKGEFDAKAVLEKAGLNHTGVPVDMALFGRMVTSDLMLNVEASSQFAHAISTHEWTREFDFWTRVDDRRDKRLEWYKDVYGSAKVPEGTDGMGDTEFTSACFYIYFNVDFDSLVDNLTGAALNPNFTVTEDDKARAKERACKAVLGLVKAAISERPTGKFNSMASPTLPTLVLIELRSNHTPVSYVNAFLNPVDPKNEEKLLDTGQICRIDLAQESARRLIEEANRITKAFNRKAKSRLLFTGGIELNTTLQGCEVTNDNQPIPEDEQNPPGGVPFKICETTCDLEEALKKELESVSV